MKCNSCQNLLDEGSKFCPHCGGKVLNAPTIVLCPGTPEDPCGAELQESFKFCNKCGTVVDQSLFGKKKEVCINCGNPFTKDGEKFCAQCGTPRQGKSDGRTTSSVEIEKRPSEKVDDDDSSAVVQIQKSGATSLKSGQLASSNSTDSSKANDKGKKSKKKKKNKRKKSEALDNGKKEDQKHQEEKKKGKKSEAHDNDKKEDQKHQEEKKKGKKSEAHDNDKKEDQKHQEKIKDIEEKGVNTSQIKMSTGLSSEKEDISEATQYMKVQMNAKPEAEKMGSDANTDNSAENKNEKMSSLEETKVNYTDQQTNQETKQDTATHSAEGKEEIWKSDHSSSANLQTDDSAKLDKSQMNENANNDKPDQKSDVLPKKSQGRNKNESAEIKVQNVTTQKTGGKSSSSCKIGSQGIKTDAVLVHFHAIISPEFGLEDKDKVIVKFGEQKLGGWDSNEHKCTSVRYMEDDYMEFELHMNIPKEIFFRSGKRIEYKYVVLRGGVKKNLKYVWENYCTQYAQDTNRNIAMRDNQSAMGLYASEN